MNDGDEEEENTKIGSMILRCFDMPLKRLCSSGEMHGGQEA